MGDVPDFLALPERTRKPRVRGLTHVLDKGLPIAELENFLAVAGHAVDVVKIGWGIGYIDRCLGARVAACHQAGVVVSLGGTLVEIAVSQGRIPDLSRWATQQGIDVLEVSNGLGHMSARRKTELIAALCQDFVVLAETGSKDGSVPVIAGEWVAEMEADLAAGASLVVAEGRESGTVGLYSREGAISAQLVDAITGHLPLDRVIFEAPQKSQQAWLVDHVGVNVNLGNIPTTEVLPVETLRLGLRADTAHLALMDSDVQATVVVLP
ncbi:MAG: phosphosulfolactate synthase [Candidatus Dormibacteraeota bacterium]|nr:phosphosulfolactate synthase [Candidatus Dormibacteraeota bacterium]